MRVAVDARFGLVVITGDRNGNDSMALVHAQLGISERHPDPLRWLIEHDDARQRLDAVELHHMPQRPLRDASLLAPIARPSKVVAAPVNYLDHQAEMKEQHTIADFGVFLKAPSSILGPDQAIQIPYTDRRVDQEGELGVVIGRRLRFVDASEAMGAVFGYTCLLDISLRSTEDRSTRKSFDTFTPIGPWVVTADEVGDPGRLDLRCWVDGTLRQHVSTGDLIFDVATLVAYTSSVMTLEPGDIIATGTPAGVGPINEAQNVRLAIERIGELTVRVDATRAVPYAGRPRPATTTLP